MHLLADDDNNITVSAYLSLAPSTTSLSLTYLCRSGEDRGGEEQKDEQNNEGEEADSLVERDVEVVEPVACSAFYNR